MTATIAASPVNFHISLNVSQLERSVDFYRKLFGVEPAKCRADYAKFESENPPLTLSLEPMGAARGGALNHVGFKLSNSQELVDLQMRLELAGLKSVREEGVECCYARQTKFWLHDPDGTLWEFYVLEDDIAHRGAGQALEVIQGEQPKASAHPPAAKPVAVPIANGDWEHQLGSAFPQHIPHPAHSLREVRLRGTFNVPLDSVERERMLAEVQRTLAPGGRVVAHLLTADHPVPADALPLPGPASVVGYVPVDREAMEWLTAAGFHDVRLVKFGSAPCFQVVGAAMRETILEGFATSADADNSRVTVVYKGPFQECTDDEGRTFVRGARVELPLAAWERIRSGPMEACFVRLDTPATVAPCGVP